MIPVGSTITFKDSSITAVVIGHEDGDPIVQIEPRVIGIDLVGTYTDEQGLVRIPFFQKMDDPKIGPLSHDGIEGMDDNNPPWGHF